MKSYHQGSEIKIFGRCARYQFAQTVFRMLDIRISRLRRKLGDEAETAERIKTVWGQGYLFVPDAW